MIPAGTEFVSASNGGTFAGGLITWTALPNLAPGATQDLTITLNVVDFEQRAYRNHVEISDDSADTYVDADGNPEQDIDSAPGNFDGNDDGPGVDEPTIDEDDDDFVDVDIDIEFDLALIKDRVGDTDQRLFEGSVVTYTITVQNQGDVPSGVFSVADQAPFGTSVVAASDNLVTPVTDATGLTIWSDLPSLAPGATTTLDVALIIIDASQAPFTNFAEIISDDAVRFGIDPSTGLVQADEDSEPDDNVGIDGDGPTGFQLPNDFINEDFVLADDNLADDEDDHDIEEVDVEIFDLALTKTMAAGSPDVFFSGETVTFVVTVFNQGTVPATNVIVEDYVPSGLTPVGFDPTAIQIPGTIPVGGSIEVELDFTITGDVTGEIVNVSEIIFAQDDLGNTPPDEDSTPDDIEGNDAGGLVDSAADDAIDGDCLLYTSPSPRDRTRSRMPSSA